MRSDIDRAFDQYEQRMREISAEIDAEVLRLKRQSRLDGCIAAVLFLVAILIFTYPWWGHA